MCQTFIEYRGKNSGVCVEERFHALVRRSIGKLKLMETNYSTRAKTCLLIQYLMVLKNTVGSNATVLYSQSKHAHM